MRKIDSLVIRCSATRADRCHTEYDFITDHLRRGLPGAGCHYYIRKNGDIRSLLPVATPCPHAEGTDPGSIVICYEGGLDGAGLPSDTRTGFQRHSLRVLVMLLVRDYPVSRVVGCPDLKFDAASILQNPPPPNPGCYFFDAG